MTPRQAKTYDQKTNWLQCREAQKQFNISKTHPAISVYQEKRSDYVAAAA